MNDRQDDLSGGCTLRNIRATWSLSLERRVETEIRSKGAFHVTKLAGMFEALS